MKPKPLLLALSTAVPEHIVDQQSLAKRLSRLLQLDEQQAAWVNKLYLRSGIDKRHTVLPDFHSEPVEGVFWDSAQAFKAPGTSKRNAIYKQEAPRLAYSAANKALLEWGGDYKEITHLIFISCTGMIAPGVQHDLVHKLPLSPSVNQIAVNFMGCFGAFKGLDLASAYAQIDPKHRILVVCTELCSLHFQNTFDPELQVANALFADGAAAAIVGCQPRSFEKPSWRIEKSLSHSIANTSDQMTWEATDQGFCMGLKQEVPEFIKQHVPGFVQQMLPEGVGFQDCEWPIHPGGKSILKSIEEACGLAPAQTEASWSVLANYGNMSSSTFLFVLQELLRKPSLKEWAVGLGFGPGLTIEGILLQTCRGGDA